MLPALTCPPTVAGRPLRERGPAVDDGLDDRLRLRPRRCGCRLEPGPPNIHQNPARSGRMHARSSRTCLPLESHRSPRHSPASRHASGEILFLWQANVARNQPPPSTPSLTRCFEALLHRAIRPGGRRCARIPSPSPFPLQPAHLPCCVRRPRSAMCAPPHAQDPPRPLTPASLRVSPPQERPENELRARESTEKRPV